MKPKLDVRVVSQDLGSLKVDIRGAQELCHPQTGMAAAGLLLSPHSRSRGSELQLSSERKAQQLRVELAHMATSGQLQAGEGATMMQASRA